MMILMFVGLILSFVLLLTGLYVPMTIALMLTAAVILYGIFYREDQELYNESR